MTSPTSAPKSCAHREHAMGARRAAVALTRGELPIPRNTRHVMVVQGAVNGQAGRKDPLGSRVRLAGN